MEQELVPLAPTSRHLPAHHNRRRRTRRLATLGDFLIH